MIVLKNIRFSEGGRRVDYDYTAVGPAAKFFRGCPPFFVKYEQDVSQCPPAITSIPFVANMLPIAWFAGFAVWVPEIDQIFAESMIRLRAEFRKMYPEHALSGGLEAGRLTKVAWEGDHRLMLFSGGLDSFTTLVSHHGEALELVTVLGADIDLDDEKQWQDCKGHVEQEPMLQNYVRHVIVANLRTFYSAEVEIRLVFGWWGKVQHGLGLLGLLAPLSQLRGCNVMYIASSYDVPVAWGSTLVGDSCIHWGSVSAVHDGAELSRQDKADLIAHFCEQSGRYITIRACYSELSKYMNCGRCEKCFRTMMNLILTNRDPRSFGLPFCAESYPRLFKLLLDHNSSAGLRLFWKEISARAREVVDKREFFVLTDREIEMTFFRRIAEGEIDRALDRNQSTFNDRAARWRFIVRHRYPLAFSAVRQLRNMVFGQPVPPPPIK